MLTRQKQNKTRVVGVSNLPINIEQNGIYCYIFRNNIIFFEYSIFLHSGENPMNKLIINKLYDRGGVNFSQFIWVWNRFQSGSTPKIHFEIAKLAKSAVARWRS